MACMEGNAFPYQKIRPVFPVMRTGPLAVPGPYRRHRGGIRRTDYTRPGWVRVDGSVISNKTTNALHPLPLQQSLRPFRNRGIFTMLTSIGGCPFLTRGNRSPFTRPRIRGLDAMTVDFTCPCRATRAA